MTQRIIVRTCVAGLKGASFLRLLCEAGVGISHVASYDQPDDAADSFAAIKSQAERVGATFVESKRPDLAGEGVTFVVGWQYLFKEGAGGNVIVFHDSLLPRYRGFAPTVTALINGESTIGVTALQIAREVDAGPIVAQRTIALTYPVKISQALERQSTAMAELAVDIIAMTEKGPLKGAPQDETAATYSIWRDRHDYIIDWTKSAAEIVRFVDAVGHPYEGAQTWTDHADIVVTDASVVPDLRFERRDIGKVWNLDNGKPVVICGSGLLRLNEFRTRDGRDFLPRVRMRFGHGRQA